MHTYIDVFIYMHIHINISCPKELQPTEQQIQSKIGHVMNHQARQSSPDDLLGVSTRRRTAVDARRNGMQGHPRAWKPTMSQTPGAPGIHK